ncbi:MAG: hypothetical protein ACTTH7_04670 [Treponema sp.]
MTVSVSAISTKTIGNGAANADGMGYINGAIKKLMFLDSPIPFQFLAVSLISWE